MRPSVIQPAASSKQQAAVGGQAVVGASSPQEGSQSVSECVSQCVSASVHQCISAYVSQSVSQSASSKRRWVDTQRWVQAVGGGHAAVGASGGGWRPVRRVSPGCWMAHSVGHLKQHGYLQVHTAVCLSVTATLPLYLSISLPLWDGTW